MSKPILLEPIPQYPEAMQYLGGRESAKEIIAWLEENGASASYRPREILTQDHQGRPIEPQWFEERIFVYGLRSFRRFVYAGSWVLIEKRNSNISVLTNEVKKKLWKEHHG